MFGKINSGEKFHFSAIFIGLLAAWLCLTAASTNRAQTGPTIDRAADDSLREFFYRAGADEGTEILSIRPNLPSVFLLPSDGTSYDQFGTSVAVAGNTAVIGARGAAYIFVRSGTGWVQQTKLTAPADARGFGRSVAISGGVNTTVIVGAPDTPDGTITSKGAAYIFTRAGNVWERGPKITASDGVAFDGFGSSVAISGSTVLIGAPSRDLTESKGAAYVFVQPALSTAWNFQQKIIFSDGRVEDHFGQSVALLGNTAVVGMPYNDILTNRDQGLAVVYTRSGSTWTEQSRLVADDGDAGDQFGSSVAISGETVVVGAPSDDTGTNTNQGAAYVYVRSGTTWTQQQKIFDTGIRPGNSFGSSAAILGDIAMIGAVYEYTANVWAGSAFIFTRTGTNWALRNKYFGWDAHEARFGVSVALGRGYALGGAPGTETSDLGRAVTSNFNAPFDFDADLKTDLAVFRPAAGEWWVNSSAAGTTLAAQFGASSDKPVPGEYTSDGRTDIAVWRPSTGTWFILRSENSTFFSFPFGQNGDIPAPADYDFDGETDAAVFRPSTGTWYLSGVGGQTQIFQFGASGDQPVPADFDGDGKADIAVYRPSNGQWWLSRSSTGATRAFAFGSAQDKTVPGDYTGDGAADVALFRPSTSEWFILRSENFSFYSVPFGTQGDVPAPGDYDGDGKFDQAVFRPSSGTWFIQQSTAGTAIRQFGAAGDVPAPAAFVR